MSQHRKSRNHSPPNIVRPNILRNAAVSPLFTRRTFSGHQNQPSRGKQNQTTAEASRCSALTTDPPVPSRSYHEPRKNNIQELEDRLKDLKMYEAQTLESFCDLTQGSREFANRKVLSKLNIPQDQQIFKDLPKLEDDKSQKAGNLIKKSAKRIASRRSHEVREEINNLISELVALERKENNPTVEKLPGEDDFLGFTKFSSPNIHVPSKKAETQRYYDVMMSEIQQEFFRNETFLDNRKWKAPENDVVQENPSCKCLKNFYDEHSGCS